ncbi:MAG TPA: hypothetical protein VM715_21465, partial [Candidatus Acidoferrum sp.]|nr:hypothetical protein [Candidatus Acidoferrum sp.]
VARTIDCLALLLQEGCQVRIQYGTQPGSCRPPFAFSFLLVSKLLALQFKLLLLVALLTAEILLLLLLLHKRLGELFRSRQYEMPQPPPVRLFDSVVLKPPCHDDDDLVFTGLVPNFETNG